MDPDANLQEQLELAKKLEARRDGVYGDVEDLCDEADRLAELVLALDAWMRNGGFAPTAWRGRR